MRRKAQGFTLIEIMVVITIIAALVSTVAIVVPKMQEQQKRTGCSNNLSQLCQIFMTENMQDRGKAQKYSGVALWLSYRKNATNVLKRQEKVLLCPGDNIPGPENDDDMKRWDNVDLNNPEPNLCSYAARDFQGSPMSVEDKENQIIGCDRQGPDQKTMHHKDAIMIGFGDGSCNPMTRTDLGIGSEDTIRIGADAQHEMLKKVVYIKRGKD